MSASANSLGDDALDEARRAGVGATMDARAVGADAEVGEWGGATAAVCAMPVDAIATTHDRTAVETQHLRDDVA
jgi:hypothetical protein